MISVVICCHEQGRFLADCITSLVGGWTPLCDRLGLCEGQTFTDFELIVVDDGSEQDPADNSTVDLQRAGALVVRLKERVGTAAALNAGIREAYGHLVCVVHADDLLEPWHLLRLQEAAGDWFCYGDLRLLVDGQRDKVLRMPSWDYDKAKRKNLCHGAILFPREAWEQVGGYPELMADGREDWAMSLRLAHGGCPGHHVAGEPGYLYRRHDNNRSSSNHTPEWTAYFERQIREALPEVYGP